MFTKQVHLWQMQIPLLYSMQTFQELEPAACMESKKDILNAGTFGFN